MLTAEINFLKFACDNIWYSDSSNDPRDNYKDTNLLCNQQTLKAMEVNIDVDMSGCVNCNIAILCFCVSIFYSYRTKSSIFEKSPLPGMRSLVAIGNEPVQVRNSSYIHF